MTTSAAATWLESDELPVGTRVEVHTRYQTGRWVPGFTIAETHAGGYRVRRASDGSVLEETLTPDEVRISSTPSTRPRSEGTSSRAPLRGLRGQSARHQNRCGPTTMVASPPSDVADIRIGQTTKERGLSSEVAHHTPNVVVLDSCHSTWVFDPCRLEFCRILKGLEFGGRRITTEWRPYWQVELDLAAEGFTVYLNPARTRLIRSWRHTKDCSECGDSEIAVLSLEDLYDALPGHHGSGP
jgi:hypothetical protein